MFKHPAILLGYFKYSVIPAIIAAIPVVFFIRDSTFSETWLLYLGDAIFLFSMLVIMLILSRKADNDAATASLMIAGHAITFFAIVLICVITAILILIYIPGVLTYGNTQKSLTRAPTNTVLDKTHGLMFMLFVNAIVGTFAAGSFASIMMSYTARRNQKVDRAEV